MKFKLLFMTLVFMASACAANASAHPGNGEETKKSDIAGGVVNAETKKPLANVSVVAYVANKREKTVTTDANGQYNFSDLKPGTYRLVFEKDGYRKVTKDKIFIRGDEGCQINIEMAEVESFQLMPGLLFADFD